MIIYLITNKINGKQYVGQTVQTLKNRWSQHVRGNGGCKALSSAIKKYGKDSFTVEEIYKTSSLEELNKKEVEFINNINTLSPNGYNLKTGGNAPRYSEESRKKMSESRKSYKQPKEVIERQSKTRTGPGNWAFGKKFSAEHRQKLSLSHLGNSSRPKIKVKCNENGKIYNSIGEAAQVFGISISFLSQILNGKRKFSKGYTFTKEIK